MSNFWDSARGVLGTVAPLLATAVGGPLAGTATSAIIGALGLAPETRPEAVAQAVVGASPEQLMALRKADQEFAEAMAKLNLDESKLSFDDRASARAREVSVKDVTPAILGGAVTIGFFTLLGLMTFRVLPDANKDVLNILLGSLGTGWTMILSYYYGASLPAPAAASKA